MTETILEILKYTLPGLIVFLTAYLTVRTLVRNEFKRYHLELRMANRQQMLPIRLQAYERLSLFVERVNPSNLIPRVRQPEMTCKELQITLVQSIRMEFEHNLSQQIYVSPQLWSFVCLAKDEIIKSINLSASELPPDAPSMALSRAILQYTLHNEEGVSTDEVLTKIKAEVKEIY